MQHLAALDPSPDTLSDTLGRRLLRASHGLIMQVGSYDSFRYCQVR